MATTDWVAATMTIIGTLAWVATGAAAKASGVSPKPASTSAWSLVISSWARRLVVSGAVPVSSRSSSSTVRPATLAPCWATYSLAPASSWRPVEANGPVMGTIRPILSGSSASAVPHKAAPASSAAANVFSMESSPLDDLGEFYRSRQRRAMQNWPILMASGDRGAPCPFNARAVDSELPQEECR